MFNCNRTLGYLICTLWAGVSSLAAQAQPCQPDWDPSIGQPGINGAVRALAVSTQGLGPRVYTAGLITQAGGVTVNNIAQWDGSAWSGLSTGTDSVVYALSIFDDGMGGGPALYAAGTFTQAGSVGTACIAKWTGTTWWPLGTGIQGSSAVALTAFGSSQGQPALYVGGQFTMAGGVGANRIAKWNGSSWSALGAGLNNIVSALTATDTVSPIGPALYVGGNFTTAGGAGAQRIAKWDGRAWSALGGGASPNVLSLAIFDDGAGPALYAGGRFISMDGVTVNRIAKWNGSNWSALDVGMDGDVSALGVFDDGSGPALYAGGEFTLAGAVTANHVAKWNRSAWSSVGGGADQDVRTFAVSPAGSPVAPGMYVGGDMTAVGGMSAAHVARWSECAPVPGDCDADGDADLADYSSFPGCMTGFNGGLVGPGCQCADLESDSDVDVADYAAFQAEFTAAAR